VADRLRCGSGWARARHIGWNGMWPSMLRASGAGAGSSIRTDATSGVGMGAGHALDGHGSNVRTDAASGCPGASRSVTKIVEL
jgi:hypothetical protein